MSEPLADGTYAAPGAAAPVRATLLLVAIACVVALIGVADHVFDAVLLAVVAVAAMGTRAVFGRPRLEVAAGGLRVVGRTRSRQIAWPAVSGAGGIGARGPLGGVEQVLVVGVADGPDVRVPAVRGRTGAGTLAEFATALVERARIENGEVVEPVPVAVAPPVEVPLGGGWSGAVLVEGTVRRAWRPQTPTVAALLEHLAGTVDGVPRPLGRDDAGREIQSLVPGERVDYPLPAACWGDGALVGAAAYLRRVHDATVGWVPPAGAVWGRPAQEPMEVVLHGDVAAYNLLWAGPRVVGLVDWDEARPGPRVVDVAAAAYRLVPLCAPGDPERPTSPAEQLRRLPLLVAAYGLADVSGLLTEVQSHVRFLHGLGRDVAVYDADLGWLAAHAAALQQSLG